ncbi:MAG TPA: hypothetical protein VMT64_03010 [Candidatus Binataceae bacterium]|nr:hypothetical protein [Candidatus Binataceae bacterium]
MKTIMRGICLSALMLTMVGCSMMSSSGGSLQAGMSADQAVAAMGEPDLKDNVPDPNHSGASVLRYTWLSAGEAAVFDSHMKVASIENVGSSPSTLQETQAERIKPAFDPIETPLDYAFYPIRVAFTYIGAGLNCIGGGGCHSPQLPPVIPAVIPG